jgi:hypothetical protein
MPQTKTKRNTTVVIHIYTPPDTHDDFGTANVSNDNVLAMLAVPLLSDCGFLRPVIRFPNVIVIEYQFQRYVLSENAISELLSAALHDRVIIRQVDTSGIHHIIRKTKSPAHTQRKHAIPSPMAVQACTHENIQ